MVWLNPFYFDMIREGVVMSKSIYILINGYGYIEEQKQKIISVFFFSNHYLLVTEKTNN